MTVDLTKILESKRALRCELGARPVAEKLRMLEAMRERDVAIGSMSGQAEQAPATMRNAKSR
jgi:hypothetical protein